MLILYLCLAFSFGFIAGYILFRFENKKLNKDYSELIKNEFVNLANKALIEKNKMLQEEHNENFEISIKPLKEKIAEFQAKIEEYNLTGVKNTATLKEQIEILSSQNKLAIEQTEKLTSAFINNSKFRGNFGEMILEKLLKASGLINKKVDPIKGNYLLQEGFRNLDNPNSNKIFPDAVIYLAEGNRNIVIDSKASFNAYFDYVNSEDETLLKKFYQNTLDRVIELENKYSNLEGLNAPDFTLLFIPFEAVMGLIYSNNSLIEEANKRNVIITGPSTLLATLRMINHTWVLRNQNDNIKEILKTGEGIYNKCLTFISKMEALSVNFDTLRKGFDSAFTSLKGRGGLFYQVEKFRELGFNPQKAIDEKYISEDYLMDKS